MLLISYNSKRIHWNISGMQCLIPEGTLLRHLSLCLRGKRWSLVAPSKGPLCHFVTLIVLWIHSTQSVSYCVSEKLLVSLWNVLQMFESLRVMSAQQARLPFWNISAFRRAQQPTGSGLINSCKQKWAVSKRWPKNSWTRLSASFVFILQAASSMQRLTALVRQLGNSQIVRPLS